MPKSLLEILGIVFLFVVYSQGQTYKSHLASQKRSLLERVRSQPISDELRAFINKYKNRDSRQKRTAPSEDNFYIIQNGKLMPIKTAKFFKRDEESVEPSVSGGDVDAFTVVPLVIPLLPQQQQLGSKLVKTRTCEDAENIPLKAEPAVVGSTNDQATSAANNQAAGAANNQAAGAANNEAVPPASNEPVPPTNNEPVPPANNQAVPPATNEAVLPANNQAPPAANNQAAAADSNQAVNTERGSLASNETASNNTLDEGDDKESQEETRVLHKILEDVEGLMSWKHEGNKKEGVICNTNGSWISDAAGMRFDINFQNATRKKFRIHVADRIPPNEDGFLCDGNWTVFGELPFLHSGLIIALAVHQKDKHIATFIGECRVCEGAETVSGTWLIGRSSRDCKDQKASHKILSDIWKREQAHILRKKHLEKLGYDVKNED